MKGILAMLVFLASTPAVANAQPQQPAFEVASIKQSSDEIPAAGGFTQDPDLISYRHLSLKALLMRAYQLKPVQISGPDWLDTKFYDVSAKLPAGATVDEIPAMLQRLLVERFHMTLRWDTKQVDGYALLTDKGGSKLLPSADQSGNEGDPNGTAAHGTVSNAVQMRNASLATLANFLSSVLGEPVEDSTGLKGKFDITLNVSFKDLAAALRGPSPSTSDDGGYTPGVIFDAVRDLGLRLQPRKLDLKYVTVAEAESTPTGN